MSETEFTQLTIDEVQADVGSEEWIQSGKGNVQLADEEAKLGKSKYNYLKWNGQEEKILYFPTKDRDGNDNAGKRVYEAFVTIDGKKRSIRHDSLEEFETDQEFQAREDLDAKPKTRFYVDVYEITPQGSKLHTWNMARTNFQYAFEEYLLADPETRVYKVKPGKNPMDKPIFKLVGQAELKALLPKKK